MNAHRRVDLGLQKQVQCVQVNIAGPRQNEGTVPHGGQAFSGGQQGGHAGGLCAIDVLKRRIRGEEIDVVCLVQRHTLYVGAAVGGAGDDQIDLSSSKSFIHFGVAHLKDLQIHLGIFFIELAQKPRQQRPGIRMADAQPEGVAHGVHDVLQFPFHLGVEKQHFGGAAVKALPGRSEGERPGALKQLGADLLLDLRNVGAERLLGDVKLFGGSRKAARLGYDQKVLHI